MRRASAIVVTAGLLASLAGASGYAAQAIPPEASAITVPPGRIAKAVAALDAITRAYMRKTGVPGIAIAVVHDDKVVYVKGFGVREAGKPARVDADTVFQLASLSKPVGATVVAALVGRGTVKWNEPLVKHLPGFKLSDAYVTEHVTIADMYSHRSGLPDHAGDLLEDLGFDRGTILERLSLEPLDPFRSTYAYTNFGITAAAQAVANATGTPWEELSRQVLYGPLGMNSTSSLYSDYQKAPDRATLHVRAGGKWLASFTRDADPESPAGGVSSSANDMAKWLRLQLAGGVYNGKQIVEGTALFEAHSPQMITGPPATPSSRASFYGYGMGVGYDEAGRVRLSHSGAFNSGGSTTVVMLPSERLGIVVLSNGMPIGVPETIAADFMDLAEFGKIRRDWFAAYTPLFAKLYVNRSQLAGKKAPSNPAPALPDSAYTGKYASAFYGDGSIVSNNGRLTMVLGPRHEEFPLAHWTGNTFAFMPRGENAVGVSSVTFAPGTAAGTIGSFTVEYLNAEKLGTFVRAAETGR